MSLLEHPSIDKAAAALGIAKSTSGGGCEARSSINATGRPDTRRSRSRWRDCSMHRARPFRSYLWIVVDTGTPLSIRCERAACVLTHARQGMELEDLEVRVEKLEQQRKEG